VCIKDARISGLNRLNGVLFKGDWLDREEFYDDIGEIIPGVLGDKIGLLSLELTLRWAMRLTSASFSKF
jgi:hypothetical protein